MSTLTGWPTVAASAPAARAWCSPARAASRSPAGVVGGGRTVAGRVDAVLGDPALHVGRGEGHVGGRGEELEHHLPRRPHPLGVRVHLHARLRLARAGRHQGARPLHLDHADPADVHRGEVLQVAERRGVDALAAARVEQRRALGHPHRRAVDLHVDQAPRGFQEYRGHRSPPPWSRVPMRPSLTADCTRRQRGLAEAADRRVPGDRADVGQQRELGRGRARRGRRRAQPGHQLLLADGADPAGHALAAGLVAEEPGDPAQQVRHRDGVVEHQHHAGAEGRARRAHPLEGQRHVERVRADEHAGRAAEQHRLQRAGRRPRRPPRRSPRAASRRSRTRTGRAPRRTRTGRTAGSRWTPRCRPRRRRGRRRAGSQAPTAASRRC